MDFPDFNHFLQLQNYLWQWPRSRASLMVGAGLSLNARRLPSVSAKFPAGSDLARAMFDEIYPRSSGQTNQYRRVREEKFKSRSPLRIASEYQAEFKRSKLKSFLREKIPDSDYAPGDLHSLLLRLPWTDVFTTNYDTLLERTDVPGRSYQPVTEVGDLTHAFSPRIIKLHGSLPSLAQLIVTEEDYRNYPKDFAPFVNTVRQSLIENAFVLIGFSGDDPNFLEWTGWLRDEVSDQHNPIYLVGALSLSNVDRSLLAQRGVTPIDLTGIAIDAESDTDTHGAALNWFARELLDSKPQTSDKWPKLGTGRHLPTNGELSDGTQIADEPEDINDYYKGQDILDEETVVKLFKRWRYERLRYPGWVIPTRAIRSSLWGRTRKWLQPLVKSVEEWSAVDRTLIFQELNWRLEISLLPHFSEANDPFEKAINELFSCAKDQSFSLASERKLIAENLSDGEITKAWLDIAFGLLRDARESYESERWRMLWDKVTVVVKHCPELADRYQYENALWMVWNLQSREAKEALAKWSPSPDLPLAAIWKAGLLAELENLAEAQSLLRDVLRQIRKSQNEARGRNIDLLSREGWCTYVLYFVEASLNPIKGFEIRDEFEERWKELRAWDCDPWLTHRYFDQAISETPPEPKKGRQVVPSFDLGRYTVRYQLGGGWIGPWLPAFACIRLHEGAGIPMRIGSSSIGGDALAKACRWLATYSEFSSVAILVRSGNVEQFTKEKFMTRVQMASMPSSLALSLNEWCVEALRRELSRSRQEPAIDPLDEPLVEVLIEVMSRLAFRLQPDDLHAAFLLALDFHARPFVSFHIGLLESCRRWFRRLLEAASDQQLLEWYPDLVRFPFSAENNESRTLPLEYWPDPLVNNKRIANRVSVANDWGSAPPAALRNANQWLFEQERRMSGKARQTALTRLIQVYLAGAMSEEQRDRLGVRLWENTTANGLLPDLPDATSLNFLYLPKPESIDVVSQVKQFAKTLTPANQVRPDGSIALGGSDVRDRAILEIALVSKPIVQIPHEPKGLVEWDEDEARDLWSKVWRWWEQVRHVVIREASSEFSIVGDHILSSLKQAEMLLARVVLPRKSLESEDVLEEANEFLFNLRKHEVYLTAALPYILLQRPDQTDRVEEIILEDLSHDIEDAVIASARAVRHWIHLADAELVPKPPTSVIDGLIWRVVFRRGEGIRQCMDQLSSLLIEQQSYFSIDRINTIVSSLPAWRNAIRFPLQREGNDGFAEHERPILNVCLGRLAEAISIWFREVSPECGEPTEISDMRDSFSKSPLPEIRCAFDTRK